MSVIIDNASGATPVHTKGIAADVSISGVYISQERSGLRYGWDVRIGIVPMNDPLYAAIMAEIRELNYGVATLETKVPASWLVEGSTGTFPGSPQVKGSGQSGKTLLMDGFTINRNYVIRKGDYLQASGHKKVYQAMKDYHSDATGNAIDALTGVAGVELNTMLVGIVSNDTVLVHQENCVFNLRLLDYRQGSIIAGNKDFNMFSFGTFPLREVL